MKNSITNQAASFWLNEINAGTIRGALNNNPSAAVEFFGGFPALRADEEELRTVAGAAWRATATDEQLAQYQSIESGLFVVQSCDDMRAEAAALYEKACRGECYKSTHNDGSPKNAQ